MSDGPKNIDEISVLGQTLIAVAPTAACHMCRVCGGPREKNKALCEFCERATCVHGIGLLDPCEKCVREGEEAKTNEEKCHENAGRDR
jgi:hypothetical protein